MKLRTALLAALSTFSQSTFSKTTNSKKGLSKGVESEDYQKNLKQFMVTHKDAKTVLSAQIFDPDTWCKTSLSAPACWEEFAETVWQPRIFSSANLVTRKDGRPLKVCVDKCSWADYFKDFVGTAYEENRETREEYQDGMGMKRTFYNGCPKCCEKIPKHVVCISSKIKQACPGLDYSRCQSGNGGNNGGEFLNGRNNTGN